MAALGRFVIDQLIPMFVTAGLNLAPRWGYLSLLPLNLVIEREYGNYALLLGIAAALVGSATFGDERRPFGVAAFIVTAVAGLVTVTPFIFARMGISVGLPPRQFDILAAFAYLAFFITVGLLIGGCWSVVVKAVRGGRYAA